MNLSEIEFDHQNSINEQMLERSRSLPILSANIYDQELAQFLHDDEQFQIRNDSFTDHFVYNVDLSHSDQTTKVLPNFFVKKIFFSSFFFIKKNFVFFP